MSKWTFSRKRPSDKTRDPVVGEFFASDAIKDPGKALVREAIQNSLDARRHDADRVSVRVYVAGQSTSLSPRESRRWFEGVWPHYTAKGNGLRPGEVTPETDCPFLVFEDFGTTGLTGDREQYEESSDSDNPFFYFFRAEAKTAKHGDARGRWGIGKQVFPRASKAQTFFGYTETDEGGFLMGGCILKHHQAENAYYKPDGFWGDSKDVDGDLLTVPVSDRATLSQFQSDFRLTRTSGETGLSVIVPWLEEGDDATFSRDALVLAILKDYFVPILEGRLEATVENDSGAVSITNASYRSVLGSLKAGADPGLTAEVEGIEALLWLAEKARAGDFQCHKLLPCSPAKAVWSAEMLTEEDAGDLRNALADGQVVGVTATLTVRPKGRKTVVDSFTCYIAKAENSIARACHVREDLIISDVKSPKVSGYTCLVRIDAGPLATLLGDAENPAHTEWQSSSRNFKDKYVYGGLTIDFVSRFASELLNRIHFASKELDRTLLVDLFSDPGPETSTPQPKRPGRDKRRPTTPIPDLPPLTPPGYRIDQLPNGFALTSTPGALLPGTQIAIRAAYETSKGNPFRAYEVHDFDFSDKNMTLDFDGGMVDLRNANELKVTVFGGAVDLRMTGFDINRDLQVKVNVRQPVTEDGIDIDADE